MITADSSVWIDYFNGQDTPQVRQLDAALDDSTNEIVLLDVVLMEVLRGFRHDREYDFARQALAPLPVEAAGGEEVARHAAAMYRRLRGHGITVRSPIDVLLASYCITHGHTLLHRDADFGSLKTLGGLDAWPN